MTKVADDHMFSPRVIRLVVSGWQRWRMTICSLHVASDLSSLGDKGGGWPYVVYAFHRTCHLWMTKVADDHMLSPRVIGLAVSRWQRWRMTISCLRVSSDLQSLDDRKERLNSRCSFTKMQTCFSKETNLQLIRATYIFEEKQYVY